MFRASFPNSAAVKHILLNVFLDSASKPSKCPREAGGKYGKPRVDSFRIEANILQKLEEGASKHRQDNTRATLKELYQKIGAAKVPHHNRQKMPRVVEWLDEFNASRHAEQQKGRRAPLIRHAAQYCANRPTRPIEVSAILKRAQAARYWALT
jgi:hypothetical protein